MKTGRMRWGVVAAAGMAIAAASIASGEPCYYATCDGSVSGECITVQCGAFP